MFKLSAISACCSGAPLQHALEGQAGRGCAGRGGVAVGVCRKDSAPKGMSRTPAIAEHLAEDAEMRNRNLRARCGLMSPSPVLG